MGKLTNSLKKLGNKLTGKEANGKYITDIINDIADDLDGAVATLENGKVPASQLPSYVDDVLEGYLHNGAFYQDAEYENELTAETGKIYVDLPTGATYRYSGSIYVRINDVDLSDYATKAYVDHAITTALNTAV